MGTRLLVVTHERIGKKMAGPAIRTWEIAKAISKQGVSVTLSFPFPVKNKFDNLDVESFIWEDPSSIEEIINKHDVLLVTGSVLARMLQVVGHPIEIPVIVDLYDIVEIEKILMDVYSQRKQVDPLAAYLNEMFLYLRQGDYFICGSERQVDFWLGCLLSTGRINHQNLPFLDSVSEIIGVVPMGITSRVPFTQNKKIKGVINGISDSDKVVYWGGGVWDWSDPISLLEAFEIVLSYRSDVRLVFGALHHYDETIVPEMSMAKRFMSFLKTKNWIGRNVFFLDWVPYEERGEYLFESDIGVSLFLNPLESRFAVRSRLMDHLWTGLPTVCTRGDEISEILALYGLAKQVPIRDVNAVADAMLDYLEKPIDRDEWLKKNKDLINKFDWDNIVSPIIRFIKNPKKSIDSQGALYSLNYIIPLRREWERMVHQNILMENENKALREEITILRERKVVKIADYYGKIRNKLFGK